MREYFADKLCSSLAPWKGVAVIGPDKIQIKYGLFFVGIDFVVTFGKRAVVILIIDGIHQATDLDVVYSQETAFDLRKKMLEVEKMEACEIIMAGRHALKGKERVVNMTGIYSHEKCFDKVFIHMGLSLQLPPVPLNVEEVRCGCGWWARRKLPANKIVPIPVESFAVTYAQVLAILNGGRRQAVFTSNQIGITDRSTPYGSLNR